jgi:hypothetical protein
MTTRLRQQRIGVWRVAAALAITVVGLSSCAKSESAECAPTFGGGVECTHSESFDAVEWAKDNPGYALALAFGALLVVGWIVEQAGSGRAGANRPPGQGAPMLPSVPPTGPVAALAAGERQRIADNVRVGDRIVTDVGPRRVLGISVHVGGAHLLNLTTEDGATITVGRADTVRIVPG